MGRDASADAATLHVSADVTSQPVVSLTSDARDLELTAVETYGLAPYPPSDAFFGSVMP